MISRELLTVLRRKSPRAVVTGSLLLPPLLLSILRAAGLLCDNFGEARAQLAQLTHWERS